MLCSFGYAFGHFYDRHVSSDFYIKVVDVVDKIISLAVLFVFFPVFEKSYLQKETIWLIVAIQIVTACCVSVVFGRKWQNMKSACITYDDARIANCILMQQGIATCKIRFGIFVIIITCYFYFFNANCTGYRDCQAEDDGEVCMSIVYAICSCFYYTIFASQLILLTKHTPISNFTSLLFKCTGAILFSTSLIYSLLVQIDSVIADADGIHAH